SGLVIAGVVSSDPSARAAPLVGEAPARAAALAQHAPNGAIVVSAETAQHLEGWIEIDHLADAGTKLASFKVVGRTPHGTVRGRGGDRERSPFVGRADELMLLRGRLARITAGHGSIVEIAGQAGIGKSRLLWEFRRTIGAAATYLAARCQSHTSTTPYAP